MDSQERAAVHFRPHWLVEYLQGSQWEGDLPPDPAAVAAAVPIVNVADASAVATAAAAAEASRHRAHIVSARFALLPALH